MELCSPPVPPPAGQTFRAPPSVSNIHILFAYRRFHFSPRCAQPPCSFIGYPRRTSIGYLGNPNFAHPSAQGASSSLSVRRAPPPRFICRVSMASSPFAPDSQLLYDLAMGLVTLGAALGSLKFWDELAKRSVFSKTVGRKLVHISIGLLFMLFWPLFSDGDGAPYIAAFSAAINGLRMLAIGLGILKDDAVVKAMTREGHPKELLKGPLYYAMTIMLATTCFWRRSPLAPIIIANLCAGDGFADLIGRRFGGAKLPYNTNKSYVGSLAMLFFGFIFSVGYEYYFSIFGFYQVSSKLVMATLIVSSVTTFVESLPISTKLDDNLTVPLTSFVVGAYLL